MMNIAICDDSNTDRQALTFLLRSYFSARQISMQITEYTSGEEFVAAYRPSAFDLVFLDVYMTGMLGVDAAREIRRTDCISSIIFTTNSREFGAEAFDVDALFYLLKPIDREKLYTVLDKWLQRIAETHTVELRNGRNVYTVSTSEIIYAEVLGRVCTVHTEHGNITVTTSLANILRDLPAGQFCQPIRYCIVALRHIVTIGDSNITLTNGMTVNMSRRERETIKAQLAEYRLIQLRRR